MLNLNDFIGDALNLMSTDQPDLNSLATITIPSSILEIFDNNESDVRIAFVLYRTAALFPVRGEEQSVSADNPSFTAVGSAVFGANISGILTGQSLNGDNLTLVFALSNPITGGNEVCIDTYMCV